MTTARRLLFFVTAAMACAPFAAAAPPADESVTLNVVKLADLRKAIESHKGKVVVLDVWAEY